MLSSPFRKSSYHQDPHTYQLDPKAEPKARDRINSLALKEAVEATKFWTRALC